MLIPVRHHSPACARLVRDTIRAQRPTCVLIEGPSDFNERIDELSLDHQLPIAIYSYVAWQDGKRQGAYYPLCVYSPEWQALTEAQACGAEVRFIDLPFAISAQDDRRTHRYSDDRLTSSDYVSALCEAFQVEHFDDAWDLIAEQDPALDAKTIHQRVGSYCQQLRAMDGEEVRDSDLQRERYMASQIRQAWQTYGRDKVVIVTGGYHTSGLEALLASNKWPENIALEWPETLEERGIALTPYSYERLDSLVGYDAGMPSPGFYHQAWTHAGDESLHVTLIASVAERLRKLNQPVSTADLIGVECCARALASLRGHARVWRRDLTDAIQAALVKDELTSTHPFVQVMQEVLRGGERGRLHESAPMPPLVRNIRRHLEEHSLMPEHMGRHLNLDLDLPDDLTKSRLLQRLRVLEIPGFCRESGVDFASRRDLTDLTECWRLVWMPEQDAQMIEASRYGSELKEAVAAKLHERAQALERESAQAALLLLDAVLAHVFTVAQPLCECVREVIHQDGDLTSVATAMGHLLYLYAWDDTFDQRDAHETGQLLAEAFERAVWLLESGGSSGEARQDVEAMQHIRDAFERAETSMALDRQVFVSVLERIQADDSRSPAQRGACAGALWSLGNAAPERIRRDLLLYADPKQLGDFLSGLFALAREEAQHDRQLLSAVHEVVMAWNDDSFLAALPSLRLAFMYFTAREKAHLAAALFSGETPEQRQASEPGALSVSTAQAAAAMAFEHELETLAKTYGIQVEVSSP